MDVNTEKFFEFWILKMYSLMLLAYTVYRSVPSKGLNKIESLLDM